MPRSTLFKEQYSDFVGQLLWFSSIEARISLDVATDIAFDVIIVRCSNLFRQAEFRACLPQLMGSPISALQLSRCCSRRSVQQPLPGIDLFGPVDLHYCLVSDYHLSLGIALRACAGPR